MIIKCQNCKWLERAFLFMPIFKPFCLNPKAAETKDPVYESKLFAEIERSVDGNCGPNAKHFEKR